MKKEGVIATLTLIISQEKERYRVAVEENANKNIKMAILIIYAILKYNQRLGGNIAKAAANRVSDTLKVAIHLLKLKKLRILNT